MDQYLLNAEIAHAAVNARLCFTGLQDS